MCDLEWIDVLWLVNHYRDVIMNAMTSKITGVLIAQPFVQSQIKENIKAPRHWLFVRETHRGPLKSPIKWPVTRKMFPFDDVIMFCPIIWPGIFVMPSKILTHALRYFGSWNVTVHITFVKYVVTYFSVVIFCKPHTIEPYTKMVWLKMTIITRWLHVHFRPLLHGVWWLDFFFESWLTRAAKPMM